jgi:tetrahydromethanopterin S-methyltransferase subunit G
MPENRSLSTLTELQVRLMPIMRDVSEQVAVIMLRSVPLIGPALVIDRNSLRRLTALFESDADIQRDIDRVVQNMTETEAIMFRLKTHIEGRKNDLQQTLDEYERFKDLAAIEKEKAQPILKELRREGNKGILLGIVINIIMIILGIILSHFLRLWFPDFKF